MRAIDADKIDFSEVFVGASDFAEGTRMAAQMLIDKQPTIDSVKHGRWIASPIVGCSCSVCEQWIPWSNKPKYCERCGAKMDL